MASLAESFRSIVDALPEDWTDIDLDLRLADESHYVDAAVTLSQCNAMPYSEHDWHWRIIVAHTFGHAAAAETVQGTLEMLDEAGMDGELRLRDYRQGRAEVQSFWGRPESLREDFRRRRAL